MTDLVREYSNALYSLAEEEGLQETINDELTELVKCLDDQPDFMRLLNSHAISKKERCRTLDEVFASQVNIYLLNFMKVLCERNAFYAFRDCADAYHRRYNDAFGIVDATVVSAAPLKEEQLQALKEKLGELSGRRVNLHVATDESLIGGLRVEMEGRRIDNTIQTRLEQLRRTLVQS